MMRFLFPALILFFTACSFNKSGIPNLESYQAASEQQVAQVEKYLASENEKVKNFRALLKMKVKRSLGSDDVKQVVVFNKPQQLRLAFYGSSLNTLVSMLVANNGAISAIDLPAKKAYFAASGVRTLEGFLGLPLDLPEVMLLFVGQVYLGNQSLVNEKFLYFSPDQSHSVLNMSYIDGRKAFARLDPNLKLLELSIVDSSGNLILKANYQYSASTLPSQIDLELPKKGVDIEAVVDRPSLNAAPPQASLFQFTIPPDFSVYQVDPTDFDEMFY